MRLQNRAVTGVPVGRQRDWIPVTTLAVPTVWMATAEGLICIDLVAVELAVNGLRKGWTLSSDEAAYAADLLLQRGVDYSTIARRLGVSGTTMRKWFPTDTTPLCEALSQIRTRSEAAVAGGETKSNSRRARCGTYSGAQRHRRQGEPLDDLCRKAKRAADQHYKANKTYIGCPEFDE